MGLFFGIGREEIINYWNGWWWLDGGGGTKTVGIRIISKLFLLELKSKKLVVGFGRLFKKIIV